jgi:hypothetical protein
MTLLFWHDPDFLKQQVSSIGQMSFFIQPAVVAVINWCGKMPKLFQPSYIRVVHSSHFWAIFGSFLASFLDHFWLFGRRMIKMN